MLKLIRKSDAIAYFIPALQLTAEQASAATKSTAPRRGGRGVSQAVASGAGGEQGGVGVKLSHRAPFSIKGLALGMC